MDILDTINLDDKTRPSVNYAKAREAIEQAMSNRKQRRICKSAVIELLGGSVITVDPVAERAMWAAVLDNPEATKEEKANARERLREAPRVVRDAYGNNIHRRVVVFPDGSQAKY